MRNLLLVVLLSAPLAVACGETPTPAVPSVDMPEAGAPEMPAAPDATDAGAAAAPTP